MLHQISSYQFTEWIAYSNIEPFGEKRADLRNGILISSILNTLGVKPRAKPSDFMLNFDKTDDEMKMDAARNATAFIEMMKLRKGKIQ